MQAITRLTHGLRGLVDRISRKNKILAALVGACLISTGTLMATAPQHDPSVIDEKSWPVSRAITETQTLSPELSLFGRVETPRHAKLSAAISAEVTELHIAEGQRVSQGELLLSLDSA